MRTKESDIKTFEYFDDDNNKWECDAVETQYWSPAYGADADGNRGIGIWLPENIEFVEFRKNGKEVLENELPPEVYNYFEGVVGDAEFKYEE